MHIIVNALILALNLCDGNKAKIADVRIDKNRGG